MRKNVLIYGIGTAVGKGAMWLCLPLLLGIWSVAEVGRFSLVQTAITLLTPLVCLNGMAGILREGSTDHQFGQALLKKFWLLSLPLIATGVLLFALPSPWQSPLAALSFLIAGADAWHQLGLSYLRCADRRRLFLVVAVLRAGTVALLTGFAYSTHPTVPQLLTAQAVLYFTGNLWLVPLLIARMDQVSSPELPTQYPFASIVRYCVLMLPHNVAQWVMSGSDRFILKAILGDAAVGLYSIAYSLAMVLMLLISGLGMALPQEIVRHYQDWNAPGRRLKAMMAYSLATFAITAGIVCLLEIDRGWSKLLGSYDAQLPTLVSLVAAGLYLLGVYFFFSGYLFYHRRTGTMAAQTAAAAIVNVLLTTILVMQWGTRGAALGTLLAYGVYLALTVAAALRHEPALRRGLVQQIAMAGLFVTLTLGLGTLQTWAWER